MAAEKIAVKGDKSGDHQEGAFKQPANTSVKINNIPVIVVDDEAENDNAGHTNIKASEGSGTVFAYNKKIHRNNDKRNCDGKTEVTNQSTVFAG
jgi:uncharacterized Zn-binding protein involved in type VI secretion